MSLKTKEINLSSGEIVTVQVMSYLLWCELEEDRDDMLQKHSALMKEENFTVAQACAVRYGRERREKLLAACVHGWPQLREGIGLDDVLMLERAVEKLSQPELEAENLSPAVAGAATQSA